MKLNTDNNPKNVKISILDLPPEAWVGLNEPSGVEQLAGEVAWLHAVHRKRAEAIAGIPMKIEGGGGAEIDAKDLPFELNLKSLLKKTSFALDLTGAAYWFKIRQGSMLREVRWLHPATITPEISQKRGELMAFKRKIGAVATLYPVADNRSDDLGWSWLDGMVEIGPGRAPSAVAKTAAEVLKNITATAGYFFERGAIDNIAVISENLPSENERSRIKGYLNKLFRRGIQGAGRIEVLAASLKFEKLNSPVKDWQLPELTGLKAEEICLAHDVPLGIMQPRLVTNKSTMDRMMQNWLTDFIAPQAAHIVDDLNRHILNDQGYNLTVDPQQLSVNQEDERNRSVAYAQYYASGMPPETIVAVLGIHVPDGLPLERDIPLPPSTPPPVADERLVDGEPEPDDGEDRRSVEMARLKRFVANGTHHERPFRSDILTQAEIEEVVAGQDAPFRGDWQDYP